MRNSTQSEDVRRRVSTSANLDEVMSLVEQSCNDSAVLTADDSVVFHRHQLEQEVRNRLMAEPSLNFTSLVVRRVRSGLCLEGVLETNDSVAEVSQLVRQICGVPQVLDRLVVHRSHQVPRKG
ncbi:MAG: hypothetical protein IAG10_08995 [Planctomycetaceae bacterium]|nr:hypothetical protein [Planctomycetaceae bacterium]